jgi:hypothetical protein
MQPSIRLLNKREFMSMTQTLRKNRTVELQRTAIRILQASGADISQEVAVRPLARALAKLSGCNYRTAVRHIELAIQQARHSRE